MTLLKSALILQVILLFLQTTVRSQDCTTLGQTPATAFPVCGTTTFNQSTVPICTTNDLFVPGCSGAGGANYQNKNPFFYKFTCYVSGTLGFLITPLAANEDYDWQLFDITGHHPNAIFTNNTLVVTANWAGTYGTTGASATGVAAIQCASDPADNLPTFARMPNIIAGHEYLLLVSHFTDGQSGYDLSFGGGTGIITDPALPHMLTAKTDCAGTSLTLKLNKKIRCNSLSANGSEFSISPAVTQVIAASTSTCSAGFDFDEVNLTLAAGLPDGNYQLIINNGVDGNTLLDICGNRIAQNEQIPFQHTVPQPIFADSIGPLACAPDSVRIYFPKKINCGTASPNDFLISGPAPLTVSSVGGSCINGQSNILTVKFTTPVYVKGTYQLTLQAGTDGNTVIDECGLEAPVHTLPFNAVDTVSAAFTYTIDMDCRSNALHFSHNGAHDVNAWIWNINNRFSSNSQTFTQAFPATSTNTIMLTVSNGICSDSITNTVVLDNEVKAGFDMPAVICPEDPLVVTDSSSGHINTWQWNFDVAGSSILENPASVHFPQNNIESYYIIRQVVTNTTLGCSDSLKKTLRVLNNCFIAVPTGFTPNGDGLNDYLYPNNALKADNLKFSVYNRWGQVVFTTRNWQAKWDGKIKGITQATGVYVWMLEYTHRDTGQRIFQKGTSTLIR